jgi:biopolymer transport protein ExbB
MTSRSSSYLAHFGSYAAALLIAVAAYAQQTSAPAPAVVPAAAAPEKPAISTRSLLGIFHDGGPLMYPIALCSVLTMVFVLERLVVLRSGRVIPRPFAKKFLEQLKEGQLDRESALERCKENGSPLALVFAAAVKKWGRTAVEVEQAIIDTGERVNNDLRKYLRVLNGVAQVGPLLGLLGTVLGMITSFNTIAGADAMGQREMLAGGIAQALLTTAAGMLVAIPALIAYLYFVGRVDRLIMDIDGLGQQLVELISADALNDRDGSRNKRTKAA